MKNSELYYVTNNVSVLKSIKGAKLVIAMNRALTQVKEEIRLIELIIEDSDDDKKYKDELTKLQVKYSNKDASNKPIIINEQVGNQTISKYDISNVDEFNIKFKELNKKYKSILDLKQKAKEEYLKALNSESEFKKGVIKESDIPDDINFEQIEIIFLLLDF